MKYLLALIFLFSFTSQASTISMSAGFYDYDTYYGDTIEWPPYADFNTFNDTITGEFNFNENAFDCTLGGCSYLGASNMSLLINSTYSLSSVNSYEETITLVNNPSNTSSSLNVLYRINPASSDWQINEGTKQSIISFQISGLNPVMDSNLPDFLSNSYARFGIYSSSPDSWFSVEGCPCGYAIENWYTLDGTVQLSSVPLPPASILFLTGLIPLLKKRQKNNY